ncbi:hypothetical protein OT109_19535 [Phycisphaeraceae bacterium D3-23]
MESAAPSRFTMLWVWVVLILILTCLGFFFYGRVLDGYKAARLLAGHDTAQGVITQGGFPRNPAKYRVAIDGQSYTGQAGQQGQGEQIDIAYLPNDPSSNRPKDGLWFDAVAGGAIALAIPIVLGYIFLTRNQSISPAVAEIQSQAKLDKAKADRDALPPHHD